MKNIILAFLRLIVESALILFTFGVISSKFCISEDLGVGLNSLRIFVVVLTVVAVYLAIEKGVERVPLHELFKLSNLPHLFNGLAVGAVFMSLTIGIMTLLGGYSVDGFSFNWREMYMCFLLFLEAAVCEEIIFRGVIYKRIASISNPYVAIVVSGLIFGLFHICNKNATVWSSFAIAIEAGTLLAAAYMLTKNLLFPIGIHFAWNFVQGYLFGAPVSGSKVNSLTQATLSGNEFISGGDFGPEASVVTVVLGIALTCCFIYKARKNRA